MDTDHALRGQSSPQSLSLRRGLTKVADEIREKHGPSSLGTARQLCPARSLVMLSYHPLLALMSLIQQLADGLHAKLNADTPVK